MFQDMVMEVQSSRGLRASDPGFEGEGGKELCSPSGAVEESLVGLWFLVRKWGLDNLEHSSYLGLPDT